MSPAEYLYWDRATEGRHEYADGVIIPFTGASPNHNLILVNVIGNCHAYLKGKPCKIYPSNLRIYVKSKESYFYPDASIVCGELEFTDTKHKDTVKNPAVIFEILSASTEDFDQGRKFFFYMQMESLKEYITIDSRSHLVRLGRRQADNSWKFEEYSSLSDKVLIHTIQFPLPLAEIYDGVQFTPAGYSAKKAAKKRCAKTAG